MEVSKPAGYCLFKSFLISLFFVFVFLTTETGSLHAYRSTDFPTRFEPHLYRLLQIQISKSEELEEAVSAQCWL